MVGTDAAPLVRGAGLASLAGGVIAAAAMVVVLVTEATAADGAMGSAPATVAGWGSFVAAALLVVGLVGVGVRYVGALSPTGEAALLVLAFATAVTVGAMSTLALVVPALLDRVPGLVNDPPAAVPATFVLSGLLSGASSVALAVSLRRAGHRGLGTNLLFAGAVVTMLPIPSRFFMLAIAVGVLLLAQPRRVEESAVSGAARTARPGTDGRVGGSAA